MRSLARRAGPPSSRPSPRPRSPSRLGTLALALVGLGVFALSSPTGCARNKPCKFNSDCVQAYCAAGVCQQDCVDSETDCPKGQHCNIIAKCEEDDPSTTTGTGGMGPENCVNGVDDDDNGKIDCEDPACAPDFLCVPSAPPREV